MDMPLAIYILEKSMDNVDEAGYQMLVTCSPIRTSVAVRLRKLNRGTK